MTRIAMTSVCFLSGYSLKNVLERDQFTRFWADAGIILARYGNPVFFVSQGRLQSNLPWQGADTLRAAATSDRKSDV